MSGFSNPIIGGGGGLVYPSIHSPNFAPGVSGWSIRKDGSAEFDNLNLRGTFTGTDYVISPLGEFFYNGVPGLGNPPVLAICPPGTTQDPFGNPASPVLNIGNVSAAHMGWATNGNMFVVNAAGKIIGLWQTSDGALILYNPAGAGLGNVNSVIAPAAGSDPSGNNYPAGFSSNDNMFLLGTLLGGNYTTFHPATINPESWQAAALSAGFTATGAPFATPGYQKEGVNGGRVRLRGEITMTAAVGSGNAAFTLPVGYQPAFRQQFAPANNLTGAASLGTSVIQVQTNGQVQLAKGSNIGDSFFLDGIVLELD